MGFFVWEENPLLLQEANAIRDIACIFLRKTRRIVRKIRFFTRKICAYAQT